MRWADRIAQINHDIEDGIRSGILPKVEILEHVKKLYDEDLDVNDKSLLDQIFKEDDVEYYLPLLSRFMINFLVTQIIKDSISNLNKIIIDYHISSNNMYHTLKTRIYKDFTSQKKTIFDIISYNHRVAVKYEQTKEYMYDRIVNSYIAQSMDSKSEYIITKLFQAIITNPQQLPDKTIIRIFNALNDAGVVEMQPSQIQSVYVGKLRQQLKTIHAGNDTGAYRFTLLRVMCDYIAGMTDHYALSQYDLLYGNRNFNSGKY